MKNLMKSLISSTVVLFLSTAVYAGEAAEASKEGHQVFDARTVIWVTAEEKALLLSEMRSFLVASQKILQASLEDNMDEVEQAARDVGVKMAKATPKELHQKFPAGFKEMGPKAHMGFEEIADEASGLGDSEVVLNKLAQLQKSCIECHAAYQLDVKRSRE